MPELDENLCELCRAETPGLSDDELAALMPSIAGWQLVEVDGVRQLQKEFHFPDFVAAQAFLNRVADVAEREGHHPAMLLEWGKVTVYWWTHRIRGLHRNDAIMAAKTDNLVSV